MVLCISGPNLRGSRTVGTEHNTPAIGRVCCLSLRSRRRLLSVRILPNALPQTSKHALGATIWSGDSATAFIFYDRVLGLETRTMLVQTIFGRVLAHEIAHLLLRHGGHSKMGIMRGNWNTGDLEADAPPFLGLSASAVRLMQAEVSRLSR